MKKVLNTLFVFALLFLLCVGVSAKTVLLGDVDMNGKITASDARTVLRVSARLEELEESIISIADTDKNGKITSADARKILRIASKLDENENIELSDTVFLNQFMRNDDKLELFVASCEVKKQDGFVFKYKQEIFIHDGGHKNTGDGSVYDYLCKLRSFLLPDGVDEDDENYKLKITVILSHFHTDHMNTYLYDIIPSPYFEIDTVYMPKQSVFEHTSLYSVCDPKYYSDGVVTTKGRLAFIEKLSEHSPETEVVCLDFGEVMQIKSDDGEVTFDMFAPSEDWGTQDRAQKILDLYYDGGKASNTAADFPKAVVNSNSMWLKISYKDRTMLFTGDVMKRAKNAYSPDSPNYADEPFDVMLSYYAEKCGSDIFDVDIVKFPHHGQVRAEASKGVFEVFTPALVICTSTDYKETTVEKAQKFWAAYTGSYCLADAAGLYLYTDGKSVSVHKDSVCAELFDILGNRTSLTGEILEK